MKIPHTQSHLVPVLSTSPIDYYYDGGTVWATWYHVVNTEFYSWYTSFGLVNPRLRYSCGQVVFVNLGTFFKCFLQLGWRLTRVRSTQPECSLNVPRMFPECSLNVCLFAEEGLSTFNPINCARTQIHPPECSLNVP
jgi:hypothetical protein